MSPVAEPHQPGGKDCYGSFPFYGTYKSAGVPLHCFKEDILNFARVNVRQMSVQGLYTHILPGFLSIFSSRARLFLQIHNSLGS